MLSVLRAAAAGLAVTTSLFTNLAYAAEPSNASIEAVVDGEPALVEQPPADRSDVPLTVVGKVGTRPVVVNPKNASQVVAAFVSNSACYARSSTNGGRSWLAAKKLPLPAGIAVLRCSDAVLVDGWSARLCGLLVQSKRCERVDAEWWGGSQFFARWWIHMVNAGEGHRLSRC